MRAENSGGQGTARSLNARQIRMPHSGHSLLPRKRLWGTLKAKHWKRSELTGDFAMRLWFLIPLFLPISADAFLARNGMTATQIGPTEIAVAHEVRRDATDYWCAAGDFARQVLGQPGKTRIWRATPKPREAGKGIVFTLDPAHKAEGAGLSQFGSGPRDGSLSVGMAVSNFCRLRIPFWVD